MAHGTCPRAQQGPKSWPCILHWKNETSVSENGVSQAVQYTNIPLSMAILLGKIGGFSSAIPQIPRDFFDSAGWSSSKVLNFMTTLKSHMNTTTLSKEESLA